MQQKQQEMRSMGQPRAPRSAKGPARCRAAAATTAAATAAAARSSLQPHSSDLCRLEELQLTHALAYQVLDELEVLAVNAAVPARMCMGMSRCRGRQVGKPE